MKVKKAIIPVAGFGTRFLPQTKAMPKEMLPIVDRPIIQILVEELVKSGIKDIILVTGYHKRAIEDHFDIRPGLEDLLKKTNKKKSLREVKRISDLANFIYVRQKGPIGNATPIANALSAVGEKEPFLVCWGDEFILSDPPFATQLIETYEKYNSTVFGAIRTKDPKHGLRFGFAKGKEIKEGVIEAKKIVEKPGMGRAPSELATVAGFVFSPKVRPFMKRVVNGTKGREPNYIDATWLMMQETKEKLYVMEFKNSRYFDTGSKFGYLQAQIELGLEHPETSKELKEYLKNYKL